MTPENNKENSLIKLILSGLLMFPLGYVSHAQVKTETIDSFKKIDLPKFAIEKQPYTFDYDEKFTKSTRVYLLHLLELISQPLFVTENDLPDRVININTQAKDQIKRLNKTPKYLVEISPNVLRIQKEEGLSDDFIQVTFNKRDFSIKIWEDIEKYSANIIILLNKK